jgi:4-amino-4-deoxy-L-arabinose transferase-like glycosyltransferase
MKKYEFLLRNPFLLFSPFLIIFILYVLKVAPSDLTSGDPARYLMYAKNLINGFYSPPAPNIFLRNGPGYPMVLVPFLLLKLPLIAIALFNPFLYYFSIVFLYKALIEIVSQKTSLIFSLGWACYYVAYQNLQYIVPETWTYFLISVFIYFTIKALKGEGSSSLNNKYVILSGFIFGNIVLAKMIFGYVIMVMLAIIGILWIINKNQQKFKKSFFILILALVTTFPYLLYTYNLTGRIFYWGMGSDTLYWMSTPYNNEYGDWKLGLGINNIESGNYNIPGVDSILRAHHEKDLIETEKYIGLEWDDAFKELALKNIKEHPLKYAQNIVYNIGRLIFHYPFSYAVQRPKILLVLPLNGILLTLMLFSLIPTLINWRKIPIEIHFLLIFALLYLGASVLVTTFVRMFTIVVPILLMWIAYVLQNTMKINLKFKEKPDPTSPPTPRL